jgi:uncharacterized membrane protein YoaK (UPF0700 family)
MGQKRQDSGVGSEGGLANMDQPSNLSPSHARDLLLLLLAATSGYVDAVSYLGLGQVFTSNMTGNTVLLGLALGQAQGLAALRSAVALAGFLCGVAIGASIVRQEKSEDAWPFPVTAALGLEMVALVAFAIVWGFARTAPSEGAIYLLIALAALAMGSQSVSVRSLGVKGVTTTYITGTWTSLVSGLVRHVHCARSHRDQEKQTQSPAQGTGLQAAVLAVYIPAAVAGSVAETHLHLVAGILPVLAVGLVVAAACLRFHYQRGTRTRRNQTKAE